MRRQRKHNSRNVAITTMPIGGFGAINAYFAGSARIVRGGALLSMANSSAPGDRQGVRGESPSQQRSSQPCCPRVMRVEWPQGTARSVDRGTSEHHRVGIVQVGPKTILRRADKVGGHPYSTGRGVPAVPPDPPLKSLKGRIPATDIGIKHDRGCDVSLEVAVQQSEWSCM